MVRVNLLPAAYELHYQRARRLRRWITIGSLVVAMQVPAFVTIRQLGSQARELQRGLQLAALQQKELQTRLDGIAVQQAEIEKQIELADRLSGKHRWSELFASVARALPETAVLTRLDTDPSTATVDNSPVLRVRSPAEKTEAADPRNVAGGLVIGGVSMDHDSVAVFLRNLNANGQVGRCSLESTLRQPFLRGEGVSFTVRAQW